MKRKKILIMVAALAASLFFLSEAKLQTVYAEEGRKTESGSRKYPDEADRTAANTWKESEGAWYYLGSDGCPMRNSLICTSDGYFYADKNGRRAENRWVLVGDKSPNHHEKAWYYFGSNGRAYVGSPGVRRQIDGKLYVFDEEGKMQTGWFDESGNRLTAGDSPVLYGAYYAGEDGALWNQEWMNYSSMPESGRDSLDSGLDGINYNAYRALWLYFDSNCRRVKAVPNESREKVIEDNTYGFDENGVMLPWWNRLASGSNTVTSVPQEPVKYYSAYNGGKLLKNSWLWMYPSEGMDQRDYENEDYSWWHTDEKGRVYRDMIKKLHGRYYGFDKLGRMQTGFVLYQGRKNFVAQYNLDVWTSEQFKYGDVLGLETSDLYLFGPDELNDGSMQMGNDLKVELADGIYTFGFGKNGVAYGNGNKLQKVKNSYYINGLKLAADENYGYGIVQEGTDSYKIVDNEGKVIQGDRRILQDRDGSWILMLKDQYMARVSDGDRPRWCDGPEGPGFYHFDRENGDKCGELITQYGSAPDIGNLPAEEQVYLQSVTGGSNE